jgi:hypothetical protein
MQMLPFHKQALLTHFSKIDSFKMVPVLFHCNKQVTLMKEWVNLSKIILQHWLLEVYVLNLFVSMTVLLL